MRAVAEDMYLVEELSVWYLGMERVYPLVVSAEIVLFLLLGMSIVRSLGWDCQQKSGLTAIVAIASHNYAQERNDTIHRHTP